MCVVANFLSYISAKNQPNQTTAIDEVTMFVSRHSVSPLMARSGIPIPVTRRYLRWFQWCICERKRKWERKLFAEI